MCIWRAFLAGISKFLHKMESKQQLLTIVYLIFQIYILTDSLLFTYPHLNIISAKGEQEQNCQIF